MLRLEVVAVEEEAGEEAAVPVVARVVEEEGARKPSNSCFAARESESVAIRSCINS